MTYYKTAFVLLLFLVKPLREVETARFEASFEISTKLRNVVAQMVRVSDYDIRRPWVQFRVGLLTFFQFLFVYNSLMPAYLIKSNQ